MDVIFIQGFRAETLIGIYEWERKVPQPIEIEMEIGMKEGRAAESDEISDTIDYGKVVIRVREVLAGHNFLLLEALAEHLAEIVLLEFGSPWVRLSVAKMEAMASVARLGVRIERTQPLG
ncbi:MAG TPA: dihydroneopterin aldolase [Burkholderiales bacterium]|nr:dihydroneopterin aldolase [Burkholderiales bacterium]